MLRSVRMAYLRAQVPSRDAAAATRAVARAGLLHLVDLAHGRATTAGAPESVELLAAFRDLERRLRRVARRLGCRSARVGPLRDDARTAFADERAAIEATLSPLERAVDAAAGALDAAEADRARLTTLARRTRALADAGIAVERLALRFTDLRLGVAREEDLTQLASLLQPAPFAIVPLARDGEGWLFAVAVPASSRERLDGALRLVPHERVPLPSTPREWDADELARAAARADARATAHAATLARLRDESSAVLDDLIERAELGVLLLQAQTQFATVGRFVVISGWVPADDAPALAAAIAAATSGRAVVDLSSPEEMSEVASGRLKVPILHRNPLLLRPFSRLVRLYGLPSYQEVEPTAFFAVSFLLMFGLMFGDVGHGAVLFAAGFCLFRYLPRFLDYGVLLMEGGAASMLFGALYGSVFGREGILPTLWLRPLESLPRFMAIATGLGVALMSLGLVLDVVNRWRAGQRLGVLTELRGLPGAFLYWVTIALVARAFLPARWRFPTGVLLALAALPIALLLARPLIVRLLGGERRPRVTDGPIWLRALEGSVELVDVVFSFFANTFSFVRVAAFAAVHAGIMIAVGVIADTVARARLGGAWSIVALIAGNVLVIFLEGLTVSVQVLRLEYYEFFSHFFRGGGEPYRPLDLQREKGNDDGQESKRRASGDDGADRGAARPARDVGLGAG